MKDFFSKNFSLLNDFENISTALSGIKDDVHLKGTNLIILIIAIVICSVGLNINSTPAIIGAMLISPIMKPIIGFGISLGTYDVRLLKSSIKNIVFAVLLSVFASTIYFIISPIDIAYSEILARTNPNIYDVIIAFLGGLAAMLAIFTHQKGTVIPGAAIATALIPPLCTVGFGLANSSLKISLGAFYLFIINLIFISLSALLVTKILPLPNHARAKNEVDKLKHGVIYLSVVFLIIPSLYFAYKTVQYNKFTKQANSFIKNEVSLENGYVLQKNIDASTRTITLVYGGEKIKDSDLEEIRSELIKYNIGDANLNFQEGFTYLNNNNEIKKIADLQNIIVKQSEEIQRIRDNTSSDYIYSVSKALLDEFTAITEINVYDSLVYTSEGQTKLISLEIKSKDRISTNEKNQIFNFLEKKFPDYKFNIEYKE